MNTLQSKLLTYAGLVLILNLLFPPVAAKNGFYGKGRGWLWSERKSYQTTVQESPGKFAAKWEERFVEIDLVRLVVSESFILGGTLLLFGLLADEKAVRKKFRKMFSAGAGEITSG